jgi:hypothetical protein
LEAAKDVRIDFVLQPGDIAQTVTITEEAPLVESTNYVLGGTLSNATINDLPLNGRDFQNLLVLRPGIVRYPGVASARSALTAFVPKNNYMVDSIDNNDPYHPKFVTRGVENRLSTSESVQAVAESTLHARSNSRRSGRLKLNC